MRMCGGLAGTGKKGVPPATRMPSAARWSRAARSSSTGSHRLIPSGVLMLSSRSASRAARSRWRPKYWRRASETSSIDRACVSRSCRIVCTMREVHPGPSMRRATTWSTISLGPPSAAIRRSGPCDLEKLRTCTTRSGRWLPRETSGLVLIAPEWSSSTIHGTGCLRRLDSTSASCRARSGDIEMPVGFCARGWRTTATGRESRAARSETGQHARVVHRQRHDLGAEGLDEVVEGRVAGSLQRDPVAEADALLEHAADPVGGAVDDGDRLGWGRARSPRGWLAAQAAPARPGRRRCPRGRRPGRRRGRGWAAGRGRACLARGPCAGRRGWRRPVRAGAGSARRVALLVRTSRPVLATPPRPYAAAPARRR